MRYILQRDLKLIRYYFYHPYGKGGPHTCDTLYEQLQQRGVRRLSNVQLVELIKEDGTSGRVVGAAGFHTRSGMPDANRKVKGTLHWVSCAHCQKAEVRLYDRLWKVENPRDELAAIREEKNCSPLEAMKEIINPNSLEIRKNCYVEKFVATLPKLSYLQFQRIGYFNIDSESTPDNLVFNRTVGLKDTWSKINK